MSREAIWFSPLQKPYTILLPASIPLLKILRNYLYTVAEVKPEITKSPKMHCVIMSYSKLNIHKINVATI